MPRIRDIITNPSLRINSTGWSAEADGAADFSAATTGFDTAGLVQLTFTAASTPGAVAKILQAVTPGDTVSLGIHVRASRDQVMKLVATFLTADGTPISTTYGENKYVPAGVVTRITFAGAIVGEVPPNAATVSIAASVDLAAGSAWSAADTLQASKASATQTPGVIEWFDGASASSEWVGASNASASDRLFTYPILTPHGDRDPGPRVNIFFDTLHTAAVEVTVIAISEDGTIPVRNATKEFAVGGFSIVDYAPPIGVPVTYKAEQFDTDGVSVGFTESADTIIDGDPLTVWISDPLDPLSQVPVHADAEFGAKLSRTRQMRLVNLGDTTIALMGSMGLLEDVSLRCSTESLTDAAMLDRILMRTIVLVRSAPPHRIPRLLNVAIGQPNRSVWEAQYGSLFTGWDLSGAEVTRTDFDIIVPVVTWQAYIDAFPTWALFNAAYANWLDAIDNPPREA
jgi:hypothetical protein